MTGAELLVTMQGLDKLRVTDGVGRNVLEARIRALVEALKWSQSNYRQANEQLTVVQTRCTELLTELRAYRSSDICLPGWNCCHCGCFNGSGKEVLSHCRGCGEVKPQ